MTEGLEEYRYLKDICLIIIQAGGHYLVKVDLHIFQDKTVLKGEDIGFQYCQCPALVRDIGQCSGLGRDIGHYTPVLPVLFLAGG